MTQVRRIPMSHILITQRMGREIDVVVINGSPDQMTDRIIHVYRNDWFSCYPSPVRTQYITPGVMKLFFYQLLYG